MRKNLTMTEAQLAVHQAKNGKWTQRQINALAEAKIKPVTVPILMPAKYHNEKTVAHGKKFDSKKEAKRYQELVYLQKAGEIADLKRQVKFQVVPPHICVDGHVLERGVDYIADFTYMRRERLIVEDVKGVRTQAYIIKRKLMLWVHKIVIKEI